ncbi:unnamed protein product [Clavelina lepadiformis]|uniref:WD repeat-containing protein 90 n=1 Tax=Clavelina lepadiformis TaxID=159417 RepID=A0ABP0FPD2_CLALP
MNAAQKTERLLWQHPYVNVFKQFKIEDWKKASKEGDVTSTIDKILKCTVYKIQGSVPAGNYIQFPRTTTQSLGLTGRYLYILFKPIPTKYFVVHVDTVAEDGLVVRISFSNLFKEFKSTSTWLQFPFACHAAKGSVEHFASLGAKQDFMGPAPLAQKWTMLVLDLHYILSMYINRKYSHLKNIRLCANLLVKNCFTSDLSYDPRLSVRQARVLGIKCVDENFAPMPRDMNFFLPKNKEWDELYDVVRFPLEHPTSSRQPIHLPFDSIQRDDASNNQPLFCQKNQAKDKHRGGLGVIKSPRREKPKTVDVSRKAGIFSSTTNMAVSTNVGKDLSKRKIVTDLPPVGLSMLETTAASCSDPGATLLESKTGDVHVFVGEKSPEQDIVVHRHFSGKAKGRQSVASTQLTTKRTTIRSARSQQKKSSSNEITKASSLRRAMATLKPDPILKLRRVLGFGGGSTNDIRCYRSISKWYPCASSGGSDIVVYAVHAVVVAMEVVSGVQHFFIGHTEDVRSIAMNDCVGGSPSILASAQGGAGGIVRIWRFETQKCATMIRSQHATCMNALAFSRTGAVLVGVGRDGHGKTLFMVWDTSAALRHGSVNVIAKAHSDVEIHRIRVCPTDDTRMVSCGRDNIRFWRVRSNQLRSCPVAMPTEHSFQEITDVTFAPLGIVSPSNHVEGRDENSLSVFASTNGGFLVEVDFQKVVVRGVHKLLPSVGQEVEKDETMKGISLNALRFTTTYLITGSDDGVLRLWPLDLSTVFLEAEHDGPVVDVDVTEDAEKILVSTSSATLGYLDVKTRKYKTIMRSHTDVITDSCMDGLRRTISTCSHDNSIRVWDFDNLRQLYDFSTPDDTPSAITCHPMLEIFACGFTSGAIRVFHVGSTTVLSEHTNARSKVTSVIFTPSGERLISADGKGTMAVYNTSDVEHVGAPLLRTLPKVAAPGKAYGPNSIAASPDGQKIAFVGPNEYTVTVSTASMLDEVLRVDVSTGLKLEPGILEQKPKVDQPLQVSFSPTAQKHLLVMTKANRLLKLDVKSGQLLSVTEDIHRSCATAICASSDGSHLVTAGDKLIKVWDYDMSKDLCCQTFIGHSSPIHTVLFTPDHLTLITVGEGSVFMWDFLGVTNTPRSRAVDERNVISLRASEGRQIPSTNCEDKSDHEEEKDQDAVDDEEGITPRSKPPAPSHPDVDQSSAWIPPETLRTSDLDASNISEFTVDANMMHQLAQKKKREGPSSKKNMTDLTNKVNDLRFVPEKDENEVDESYDSVPVKVAWMAKSQKSPMKESPRPLPSTVEVANFAECPNVLSHFSPRLTVSQAPQRTYAAPAGQEGLELKAVVGYNGNGRGNLAWNPDTGVLAYSCGCVVVLEKLTSKEKFNLHGHTEEVASLAMQHDGQILASASGSNGLMRSRICLWDTSTLSCRATLKHHEYDIVALAYSRDDRFLISMGDYRENALVIWSSFNGLSSPVILASTHTNSPVHKVVWDPATPNEFVSVGADASVSFWMLDEHGTETTLNVHEADIPDAIKTDETNERLVHFTSACFGEDHILYVASNTGFVSAWDTSTNSCFLHWRADSAEICYMKSRGNRLLVAGASRGAKMWGLAGVGEVRYVSETGENLLMDDELNVNAEVISGAFDDSLDVGIVGTTAGTLWYLDWSEHSTVKMVTGHKDKITGIAFDEGNYFATSSEEGTVRLWHLHSLELAVQFQVIDHACTSVTFSHPCKSALSTSMTQPKMLSAGYKDGTVRVFDVDKLVLKLKFQPHTASVTALEFAASNETLLSGAKDGTVAATSMATGVTMRVLKDHRGAPINNIACSLRNDHPAALTMHTSASNDGCARLCLLCGGDRRVSVWDTEWKHDVCNMIDWLTFPAPCFAPDGSQLPKNHRKYISHLPPSVCYFHPTNPDMLIYCGYGMTKSLQHYSLTNRKVVKSIPLPNWAQCMAVSTDGTLLASGTGTRLLELVDANHGTFQDYSGHSGVVEKVGFSPDGRLLLSSSGPELFVWKVKH